MKVSTYAAFASDVKRCGSFDVWLRSAVSTDNIEDVAKCLGHSTDVLSSDLAELKVMWKAALVPVPELQLL
jgi:hypothetical protein